MIYDILLISEMKYDTKQRTKYNHNYQIKYQLSISNYQLRTNIIQELKNRKQKGIADDDRLTHITIMPPQNSEFRFRNSNIH